MRTNRIIQFLLVSILVLGTFGFAGSQQTAVAKTQPLLVELAAEEPGQTVHVIVQRMAGVENVEMLVAELGGQVTQELPIINAFSAKMTAESALELARSQFIRWVSLDAAITSTICSNCVDTTNLANAYIRAIRADKVWNDLPYLQGNAIGVAVIDSGINPNGDLYTSIGVNRQVADIRFNTDYNQSASDGYGHGTHVASIVGGDGSESGSKYIGVAPMVKIINVKVSNDDGSAMIKDVVQGLQWVLENKDRYNIRVVNLSLNSSVAESYHTSPLDAAVEILCFNKIVVVASGQSG